MPIILATLASSKSRTAPAPFLTNSSDWQSVVDSPKGALITYINRQTVVVQETLAELADLIQGASVINQDLYRTGFIVTLNDPPTNTVVGGMVEGTLDGQDALHIIAAELDDLGNVIAGRPLVLTASEIEHLANDIKWGGLQLPANTYGYTLGLLADGTTMVAEPNPAPTYSESTTGGTTNHDLSIVSPAWVKITGDSAVLTTDLPIGSIGTYSAHVAELGARTGTVFLGIGRDGLAPTADARTQSVQALDSFDISGVDASTAQINIGQTFALWARCTNNHIATSINIQGSVTTSSLRIQTA